MCWCVGWMGGRCGKWERLRGLFEEIGCVEVKYQTINSTLLGPTGLMSCVRDVSCDLYL